MVDCQITAVEVLDVRFPTSRTLAGSDAMNIAPDYSAAYVVLRTDGPLTGYGLTFTTGPGTEVVVACVHALSHLVRGRRLSDIADDPRGFWRALAGDPYLRWIGPEKGVVHLATAALVNAVWDLWARSEDKPVWKLVVDMSPEQLVGCVDFRYMTDVLSADAARELLEAQSAAKPEREREIIGRGVRAYITSIGWLGFEDEELRRRCRQAVSEGWTHMKMKVGGDPDHDVRRAALIREEIGAERYLMMDANQVWEVSEAIQATRRLAPFDPWWMEEPTSPDDILGHARIAREVAPIRVATGEHCHNRTMFKQLMQAGGLSVCQLDACRLGGVNEVLAVLLLAAHFAISVCPHAGGVGLSEYVQHIALIDHIAIGGPRDDRVVEYVEELHEHFVEPVVLRQGHYMAPQAPGYSIEMHPGSLEQYTFPDGAAWR